MHSMKNTFLAVVLLGASYLVYQVITAPGPDADQANASLENQTKRAVISQPITLPNLAPSQTPPPAPQPSNSAEPLNRPFNKHFDPPSNAEASPNDRSTADKFDRSDNDGLVDLSNGESKTREFDSPKAQSFDPPRKPRDPSDLDDSALIDALKQELGNGHSTPLTGGEFDQDPDSTPSVESTVNRPAENFFGPSDKDFEKPEPGNKRLSQNADQTTAADSSRLGDDALQIAWDDAESLIREDNYKAALRRLTRFYTSGDFNPAHNKKLMAWLNHLAGQVVYSTEHNMYKPYVARDGDTLSELSSKWKVPAQLIYNINRANIADPANLSPGTELKVVLGEFRAVIDLSEQTLTLFVKELYAGQFSIRANPMSRTGEFKVSEKLANLGPNTNDTPFTVLLDGGTRIAAIPESTMDIDQVGLSRKDAADVFSILSKNSTVTVRR